MERMTDEEIKNAKSVLETVGIAAGIESRYREKALALTKDSENWVLVMLLDMIVTGMPILIHRIETGKELDEESEEMSMLTIKSISALALLARDMAVSGDLSSASKGLALFSAFVERASGFVERASGESSKGSAKENQADFYIKNSKNPLW